MIVNGENPSLFSKVIFDTLSREGCYDIGVFPAGCLYMSTNAEKYYIFTSEHSFECNEIVGHITENWIALRIEGTDDFWLVDRYEY